MMTPSKYRTAMANIHIQGNEIKYLAAGGKVIQINHEMNTQNISGGTFHGPVGINQTFTDCFNMTEGVSDVKAKEALATLVSEVQKLHPHLSADAQGKAERKLKTFADEAAQAKPDKEQLLLSGKGLLDAANTCAQIAGPVVLAVKTVLGLFGVPVP